MARAGAQPTAAQTKQYTNPILFADYSDPDVIRDGNDFYLVASSFHFSPGLPILHSRDLVHWELSGHALQRLPFNQLYDLKDGNRYGRGVWAPAVRFHNGLFYIYFPTPDEGIFVVTAPKMTGPWSAPETVLAGAGWEDPCPFWDDDGQAYLVHSRTGAGPLFLHRMSADGKHLLDPGKIIVQDPVNLKTLEGPKLYKRHGWYYIFAPMGGVATGDQVVGRARTIDGPYEWRHTLTQGTTAVNGPHQGGWVETPQGGNWFVHFQSRGAHGRIVWLEPMAWDADDWPRMGTAVTQNAPGMPVLTAPLPMPAVHATASIPTSDEFNSTSLQPLWEWNHNPDNARWSLTERRGFLRLHPLGAGSLVYARNTLTECMQDEALEVTTRLDISHLSEGDHAGLSAFDSNLTAIGILHREGRNFLYTANATQQEEGTEVPASAKAIVQFRVSINGNDAAYAYSFDNGATFHPLGKPVTLRFSWWKGARPALFAFNTKSDSTGWADFDWLHYQPLPTR